MRQQPITLGNLYTEGLRRSRNHVREELRKKGIRLSSFKASEVTAFAKAFLAANREELIGKALGDLCWHRLCAELKTSARKMEAGKSGLSRVHMSGPKVDAAR